MTLRVTMNIKAQIHLLAGIQTLNPCARCVHKVPAEGRRHSGESRSPVWVLDAGFRRYDGSFVGHFLEATLRP